MPLNICLKVFSCVYIGYYYYILSGVLLLLPQIVSLILLLYINHSFKKEKQILEVYFTTFG